MLGQQGALVAVLQGACACACASAMQGLLKSRLTAQAGVLCEYMNGQWLPMAGRLTMAIPTGMRG